MRELHRNGATARVYPTKQQLIDDAEAYLASLINSTLAKKTSCAVALSGGSTPKPLYEALARRADIDWSRVVIWFVDERNVPPDHPDSNYGMIDRALLGPADIPACNIHRMQGELPAAEAAAEYARELHASFTGTGVALPRFDVLLLGMGPDGHTASLFPGSPGLRERNAWVIANRVASKLLQLDTVRITLTFPVLNAAKNVAFLVSGKDKAEMLPRALSSSSVEVPSSLVHPVDGGLLWLCDADAAAALLPAPPTPPNNQQPQ